MHDEAFDSDHTVLRTALHDLLSVRDLSPSSPLGADMYRLLQARGKILSSHASTLPTGFWALLPLAITRYCFPTAENALLVRVALCCEFLHCALDCFDELEDEDSSEERVALGDGRLLNAATALYTLAPALLDDLCPDSLSYKQRYAVQCLLSPELLSAMQGQHRDILAEHDDLATFQLDECLTVATTKSGSLFRLVCQMSAMAVNAPGDVVRYFADVGTLMGLVAQLENDVHDLEVELHTPPGELSPKSDIRRNKKTFPLVFAHQRLVALQHRTLGDDSEEQREAKPSVQSIAFRDAIIATLGAAAQLREQAKVLVEDIEQRQGTFPETLRLLLRLDVDYNSSS